jgi:hypothetical protein
MAWWWWMAGRVVSTIVHLATDHTCCTLSQSVFQRLRQYQWRMADSPSSSLERVVLIKKWASWRNYIRPIPNGYNSTGNKSRPHALPRTLALKESRHRRRSLWVVCRRPEQSCLSIGWITLLNDTIESCRHRRWWSSGVTVAVTAFRMPGIPPHVRGVSPNIVNRPVDSDWCNERCKHQKHELLWEWKRERKKQTNPLFFDKRLL